MPTASAVGSAPGAVAGGVTLTPDALMPNTPVELLRIDASVVYTLVRFDSEWL